MKAASRPYKIPDTLWEYLETTEQDERAMSNADLLKEARWVLELIAFDEWEATGREVATLKRYINNMSK